jgi:hypothetical protein
MYGKEVAMIYVFLIPALGIFAIMAFMPIIQELPSKKSKVKS